VFNIQGSEMIFLLLVALIILGPEKLPDAIRKFGRAYAEFKKMANGFQGELREALEEPMRELKDTADMMRNAVNFDEAPNPVAADEPAAPPPPVKREQGLNFGSANPRRTSTDLDAIAAAADGAVADAAVKGAPSLNFGSATTQRPKPARDPLAVESLGVDPVSAEVVDADPGSVDTAVATESDHEDATE
jgi:sec-independent protein translocase protein TatB